LRAPCIDHPAQIAATIDAVPVQHNAMHCTGVNGSTAGSHTCSGSLHGKVLTRRSLVRYV